MWPRLYGEMKNCQFPIFRLQMLQNPQKPCGDSRPRLSGRAKLDFSRYFRSR